jgi:hypothetical protein
LVFVVKSCFFDLEKGNIERQAQAGQNVLAEMGNAAATLCLTRMDCFVHHDDALSPSGVLLQ